MTTRWEEIPKDTWTFITDIPVTFQTLNNREIYYVEAAAAPVGLTGPYRLALPRQDIIFSPDTGGLYVYSPDGGTELAITDGRSPRDVFIQDQTTPPFDLYFALAQGVPTEISVNTVIDDYIIAVASVANIAVGDYIGIFSGVSGENRFYFGEVLAVNALLVTLDTPLDFAFIAGDIVISTIRDLNVLGTQADPVTFSIRGPSGGQALVIDVTRILFAMTTTAAVDLDRFGDIVGGLTAGIVIRRNNGFTTNIANVKINRDFLNLAFDYTPFSASNPVQGVDGLACRYTFAGQDKHGVVIRLREGDSLDIMIQDNLTSLETFRVIAAGHLVEC